ncbi:MAG: helix-turn-helix domain-containing protein [Ornithinimicrobium sp.]
MPAQTPSEGAALLTSTVRRRIMDHLFGLSWVPDEDGSSTRRTGLSAAELGELLGLHTTTVRFHLDQLVTAGLVESRFVPQDGAGRPRKTYFAVEGRLDPDPPAGPYAVLAELLTAALDPSEQARLSPEEAGIRWVERRTGSPAQASSPSTGGQPPPAPPAARTPGAWLGRVGEVIDLLNEWGYTPQLSTDQGGRVVDVTLHDCPFLDLARTHPEVVCGVHRGLLRGALTHVGETEAEISLRPFVSERTCLATLSSRTPFTPTGESHV